MAYITEVKPRYPRFNPFGLVVETQAEWEVLIALLARPEELEKHIESSIRVERHYDEDKHPIAVSTLYHVLRDQGGTR